MRFRALDLQTNGGKLNGLHSNVVYDLHGTSLAWKFDKVQLVQQLTKGQLIAGSLFSVFVGHFHPSFGEAFRFSACGRCGTVSSFLAAVNLIFCLCSVVFGVRSLV